MLGSDTHRMASHRQLCMCWQGCLADSRTACYWPPRAENLQDELLCLNMCPCSCAGMNASSGLTHRSMHRSLPASMGRMKFMPPAPRPPTSGPPSRAPDHRSGCEIAHNGCSHHERQSRTCVQCLSGQCLLLLAHKLCTSSCEVFWPGFLNGVLRHPNVLRDLHATLCEHPAVGRDKDESQGSNQASETGSNAAEGHSTADSVGKAAKLAHMGFPEGMPPPTFAYPAPGMPTSKP